jgi:ubiquinone/menaquinone biosynthesis C-methylase UbiE
MARPLLSHEEIWQRYDRTEARLSAPLSERMIALAQLRPGMRVLDLATGRGEPAIAAARRVAPSGSVVGLDVSATLVDMARERAALEGVTNLEPCVANAESLEEIAALQHARVDATLARCGLMYMGSPVASLESARKKMVPRGVLVADRGGRASATGWLRPPRRGQSHRRRAKRGLT